MEETPFLPSLSLKDITPKVQIPGTDTDSGSFMGSIGGLAGIASLAGVVGGIMNAKDEKEWRKRSEDREVRRVAREERRQDKFEGDMNAAWS